MKSPTCLCFNAVALTAAITGRRGSAARGPGAGSIRRQRQRRVVVVRGRTRSRRRGRRALSRQLRRRRRRHRRAARHGNVEIVAYDLASGVDAAVRAAPPTCEADDHDSAALYVRPDGRYVAMYSRHNTDRLSAVAGLDRRRTRRRGRPERTFDNGAGTTYSNLYDLPPRTAATAGCTTSPARVGLGPALPRVRRPRVDVGARRPAARRSRAAVRALRRQRRRQDPPHRHRAAPRDFANSIYHGVIRTVGCCDRTERSSTPTCSTTPPSHPSTHPGVRGRHRPNEPGRSTSHVDAAGHPYVVFSVRSTAATPGDIGSTTTTTPGSTAPRWHVHPMADAGSACTRPRATTPASSPCDPNDPDAPVHLHGRPPGHRAATHQHADGHAAPRAVRGRDRRRRRDLDVDARSPPTRRSTTSARSSPTGTRTSTVLLWLRGTYTQLHRLRPRRRRTPTRRLAALLCLCSRVSLTNV